jgi:hypothetical protein
MQEIEIKIIMKRKLKNNREDKFILRKVKQLKKVESMSNSIVIV